MRYAKCHPDRKYHAKELCRTCYQKQQRKRNLEKYREYSRVWQERNPEKHLEADREWQERNPEKRREASRAWQKRNPEYVREWQERNPRWHREYALKRKLAQFGLTIEKYEELKERGCVICGNMENLHMDHDHETGEFRGLLCCKHNTGLGMFGDSVEILKRAIAYLEGDA